jgi:hypothetical protein
VQSLALPHLASPCLALQAERNVLPTLNNLLENLDNFTGTIPPTKILKKQTPPGIGRLSEIGMGDSVYGTLGMVN